MARFESSSSTRVEACSTRPPALLEHLDDVLRHALGLQDRRVLDHFRAIALVIPLEPAHLHDLVARAADVLQSMVPDARRIFRPVDQPPVAIQYYISVQFGRRGLDELDLYDPKTYG